MMKKSIGIGFVGGWFITRFHIQSLIGVRDCEVLGEGLLPGRLVPSLEFL